MHPVMAALLCALLAPRASAAARLTPWWNWTWEALPVWASGQGATDFTPNVTAYYAGNFDIMWTHGGRGQGPGYETWEGGLVSDCKKVHAVRPGMPTFAYYGFYGCCLPANGPSEWYAEFNATPSLWLRDDTGAPVKLGSYVYDLCNPAMLDFYKHRILRAVMESDDLHGSFFDEVDQFIEGGGENTPSVFAAGSGYKFSAPRKAQLHGCWERAMVELVEFMASGGKFPIPSTNAYGTQYAEWGTLQMNALAAHGGFKFVESFCPTFAAGTETWMCPAHATKEACCLDQLLSVKRHAELGVPLMIHIDGAPALSAGVEDNVPLAAFLVAAQKWSYVATGEGWDGPSSFPVDRRRLGAPKGDAAAVDAARGVFTRAFDCADVSLNVSAWRGVLRWTC